MIRTEDILSLEYLKKTEFTGCHHNMRYRLEGIMQEDVKKLLVTIWPMPYNYVTTKDECKQHEIFDFSKDGVVDAVAWMNQKLFEMENS